MGDEKTLEPLQGLFIKNDVIDVVDRETCILKAELHGVYRKSGVMLNSRKPLFLSGRYNLAVDDQCSGRIVEVGAYSDNLHQNILRTSSIVRLVASASCQPSLGLPCRKR